MLSNKRFALTKITQVIQKKHTALPPHPYWYIHLYQSDRGLDISLWKRNPVGHPKTSVYLWLKILSSLIMYSTIMKYLTLEIQILNIVNILHPYGQNPQNFKKYVNLTKTDHHVLLWCSNPNLAKRTREPLLSHMTCGAPHWPERGAPHSVLPLHRGAPHSVLTTSSWCTTQCTHHFIVVHHTVYSPLHRGAPHSVLTTSSRCASRLDMAAVEVVVKVVVYSRTDWLVRWLLLRRRKSPWPATPTSCSSTCSTVTSAPTSAPTPLSLPVVACEVWSAMSHKT